MIVWELGSVLMRSGVFAEGRFLGRVLDEWADDAQEFIRLRLPHLLVVLIIGFVLSRLLKLITRRMIHLAEQHAPIPARVSQVKTLAGVVHTTSNAIIGSIVGLQILDAVGVNLGPLLASAGIAGVAIGLAAQNIVRDVLNGVLILVEDQFNVGDTVRVAGLAGIVESMSLRRTTVRDADGTVYVIPNSQITTVANQSAANTVATVNVSVDFSADPDRVMKLLARLAMEVRTDERLSELIVADPVVQGLESIRGSELIFPVVFRTKATQQLPVLREFKRRIRIALEREGLLPGDPYRVFNAYGETGKQCAEPHKPEAGSGAGLDPTLLKPQESNPFSGE